MLQYSESPLKITQIWKMAFKLAAARFFQMYFIFFLLSILMILPHFILGEPSSNLILKEHHSAFWGFGIFTIIFSLFIWPLVFYQLGTLMEGAPVKFAESLKIAIRKFPALLMMGIVVTIICMFGSVFLILPGIFLFILFSMCAFLIIFDNVGAIDSLGDSVRLVWGNWWRTFTVLFIPLLTILFILFLIKIVLISLLMFSHVAENYIAWIGLIFKLIFNPLISIYLYPVQLLQWHDLKLRRSLKNLKNLQ